jgi:hypothetical protein
MMVVRSREQDTVPNSLTVLFFLCWFSLPIVAPKRSAKTHKRLQGRTDVIGGRKMANGKTSNNSFVGMPPQF